MCKQSIMDLIYTTEHQWICSSCRFTQDHQAMLSSQPSCACGISLEETVGIYSRMWMDGLARKYVGKVLTRMEMTSNTPVNYSELAGHMLNPHHHWCQGLEGACDCIKVPNKVEASNVVDRIPEVVAPPSQRDTEDKMEETVEDDLENLPAGAAPLASNFHKFANAVTMPALDKGEYSEDLLSNRLEGRVIKEALAITLLLQFCEENPSPRPMASFSKVATTMT
jgi:hypothetical protein